MRNERIVRFDPLAPDTGPERRQKMVNMSPADRASLSRDLDGRGVVGERLKVVGENPYQQMALRQMSLQRTLTNILGVEELSQEQHRAAQRAMTPQEVIDFPRMAREEVINLGVDIAERLGWLRSMGDDVLETLPDDNVMAL